MSKKYVLVRMSKLDEKQVDEVIKEGLTLKEALKEVQKSKDLSYIPEDFKNFVKFPS